MKLIFVYNADSGFFNSLTDYTHKLISPSTYKCNLCALTYGNLGEKRKWTEFIKSLDTEFLHKDEFHKKYSVKAELPAIFDGKLKLLISAKKLAKLKTLDELINLVKNIK